MAFLHTITSNAAARLAGLAALGVTVPTQIVTENAGVASPELPPLREALSIRENRNVDELRVDAKTDAFRTLLADLLEIDAISRVRVTTRVTKAPSVSSPQAEDG